MSDLGSELATTTFRMGEEVISKLSSAILSLFKSIFYYWATRNQRKLEKEQLKKLKNNRPEKRC